MQKFKLLQEEAKSIIAQTSGQSKLLHEQSKLLVYTVPTVSHLEAGFYEPALCLILQGQKEVYAGEQKFVLDSGDILLISHALPITSKITVATEHEPYMALILAIDTNMLRMLNYEIPHLSQGEVTAHSLFQFKPHDDLVDALYRFVKVSQNQVESQVLASSCIREILFRIMQVPRSGNLLNLLLNHNSHASRIEKAILMIKKNFSEVLIVDDIAKQVGMSVSSFHSHFKAITATSPLQFQKCLRLLEARRLLKVEGESVATAALKVGYESQSQFSREYSRKFGVAPSLEVP